MARDLASFPPPPLSRREIHELLQSLSTQPPDVFWVTAVSLYGWCRPADVDAAVSLIASMPIPRCLHGVPWNKCTLCPSVHGSAVAN